MTEPTDEELIEGIRSGDRGAVGGLFDRHYDELFAFADRFLGDPHSAADAVQETFVRVLRYGDSFAGRSSFRTWLFSVTRNACLDMVRAKRRERETKEELPRPEPVPPPEGPDPRIEELRAAIDALPPTRRDVLVLRRFHDLPYAEIAELCGITEVAARARAHRALHQLRRELSTNSEASGA